MKSYESSTLTLRSILAHPSLQRERIDETMDALAEANANAREVDDAVRMGGDVAVGVEDAVDEEELERELKEMVREAEAEKEAKLRGMQVPREQPVGVGEKEEGGQVKQPVAA